MDMALTENNKQNDLTVIQISDTHLMNKDNLEFLQMNPSATFHAVMKDIQQKYPHVNSIFHTGDLAQAPVPETYETYINFMNSLGVPYYQIPGNHDKAEFFPFHHNQNQVHAIKIGFWTVILLNSAVKGQVHGWIEDEQLQQLDTLLAEHKNQHIIITCHHHPLEMDSRWIDNHKLKNSESFCEIFKKYSNIKMVLFGHVHQESINLWNNIHFYSTPSTCVQFKPKSEQFALDSSAPGYRVLHLKEDGTFSTEIHRIDTLNLKINLEISGY